MTFSIHGIAVSRGIAIGRAVLVTSSRLDVAHYFIKPEQIESELQRVKDAKNAVVDELIRLQHSLANKEAKDTPSELVALLDVHQMLLQDQTLQDGVNHWITDRLYNAEWALTTQLDIIGRQFDEMEDEYLRERKADLEQVVERVLRVMKGVASPIAAPPPTASARQKRQQDLLPTDMHDVPLILVAHDLNPADMLHFKSSVFAGFVTDVGGKTSHTAIVARSMDIPAVVGARTASQLVRQDDWVIIDGDAGVMVVDPSPIILAEYGFKQRQGEVERERLSRLKNTPAVTLDGQRIELLANIEMPNDAAAALAAGAVGVGLFRSEFLFMGRSDKSASALPDENEQYIAYRTAVEGMQGLPVTIRTVDVGADKPLSAQSDKAGVHLNPALGLRAIRWSLAEPTMFRTQLRAILRRRPRAGAFADTYAVRGERDPPNSAAARPSAGRARQPRHRLWPREAGRDDRNTRGCADAEYVFKVFRFLIAGHQRFNPIHPGHRPRRRNRGAPLRPAAPRRAATDCANHHRRASAGQRCERVRRDGRRHQPHPAATGHGPAQLFNAPLTAPSRQTRSAARRCRQTEKLGATRAGK
jgi:phosphoenolpyruvate-protein phosphotransferase (PTS system enzyme I)